MRTSDCTCENDTFKNVFNGKMKKKEYGRITGVKSVLSVEKVLSVELFSVGDQSVFSANSTFPPLISEFINRNGRAGRRSGEALVSARGPASLEMMFEEHIE